MPFFHADFLAPPRRPAIHKRKILLEQLFFKSFSRRRLFLSIKFTEATWFPQKSEPLDPCREKRAWGADPKTSPPGEKQLHLKKF